MLSRADWKAGRPIWHLWRQDIGGGAPVQLTFTEGGDIPARAAFAGRPTARRFCSCATVRFALLPADGGEARVLTRHATAPSSPTWSPDGTAVYFLAADPPTAEERERDRLRDDVFAFDEDYKQRHLWKSDVATGVEQQVTTGELSVLEYRLSRDGTRLAVQRAPTPLVGDGYRGEVWVMDANGANARALTQQRDRGVGGGALARQLAGAVPRRRERAVRAVLQHDDLFVVPAAGGTPRPLLPDFPYAIDAGGVGARRPVDPRRSSNMGVHSEIFQIDVASQSRRQLTDGRHFIPHAGWADGSWRRKRACWCFSSTSRRGSATCGRCRLRRRRADARHRTLRRARARLRAAAPGEGRVEGRRRAHHRGAAVLSDRLPAGDALSARRAAARRPDGVRQVRRRVGLVAELLCRCSPAKGYAVLRPNYRGSTGYGNAFFRDVVGDYFHNMRPTSWPASTR